MLQKAPKVMFVTPIQVSPKASESNLVLRMLSIPGDQDSAYDHQFRFYVNGNCHNKLEGSVVCPAWMVPPTDLPFPILKVCETKSTMTFKGQELDYMMKYLGMPSNPDVAAATPILIRVLHGRAYAVLMRSHLLLPQTSSLCGVCVCVLVICNDCLLVFCVVNIILMMRMRLAEEWKPRKGQKRPFPGDNVDMADDSSKAASEEALLALGLAMDGSVLSTSNSRLGRARSKGMHSSSPSKKVRVNASARHLTR